MRKFKLHHIGILSACLIALTMFYPVTDIVLADVDAIHIMDADQEDVAIFLPFISSGHSSIVPGNSFRTVNATYFDSKIVARAMGIFWFGEVMGTENYTDVRVGYNNTELVIDLRIIDRQIWYDKDSPSPQELTDWDAVTLFLSTFSDSDNVITANEYKIVGQLSTWEDRIDYQVAFQGNNSTWIPSDLPITTEAVGYWQPSGGPNQNQEEDFGWMVQFTIPFDSLGLTAPPHNELWRLGLILHDRDDAPPTPAIGEKTWPETLDPNQPQTWGGLHFGQISTPIWAESKLAKTSDGVTTIKNGLNDAVVSDAHVGGAFSCGDGIDVWTEWGNTNYENIDPTQINIQNQTKVGDWPCFSKYFITFPLDEIPQGKIIDSAELTMYHFGNSGGGDYEPPDPSWIQVLTVVENWKDTMITWNNAPLVFENVAMTQVLPLDVYPGWPGVPISWNVSKSVMTAYNAGQPLQLALYSADSEMHSGKYFFSSDSSAPPYLTVNWSNP